MTWWRSELWIQWAQSCSKVFAIFLTVGEMNISAGCISNTRVTWAVEGKEGRLAIRRFLQIFSVYNIKNVTEILPVTWMLAILAVTWYTCTKMICEMIYLFARNTKIRMHHMVLIYMDIVALWSIIIFQNPIYFRSKKWPKFCRRYFQMHEWRLLYFFEVFTELCSESSCWQ